MQYLKDVRNQLVEAVAMIDKALTAGKLPSIERDILLAKLASIYEDLLLERQQTVTRTHEKPQVVPSGKMVEPQEKTIAGIETKKTTIVDENAESSSVPMAKYEPNPEKVDINPSQKSTPAPTQQLHEESSAILADKYQGKRKFRNEVIAEQHQKVDMQSKLQNKPITDLAKAIGINDKFLFIKELFGGDADLYNQTIKHLNQLTDLNEAIIYLQEHFSWDPTSDVTTLFIDLVRRKLS